jgi:outer membrane protein OmpA-like peptidoglycan-associated protein
MKNAIYITIFFIFFCFLGCERADRAPEFHIIHFMGITEINPEDSVLLYENLETIEKYADIDVEIAGHTHSVGSMEYNLTVSQMRADTIKVWLVRKGVDSLRLTAIGYGEEYPISPNTTAQGRADNARVEFIEQ